MATITPDWDRLRALPCWTPLVEVSEAARSLGSNLYQLGEETYALALPEIYGSKAPKGQRAPFVTVVYWAASDGSARRAAGCDVDADDGGTGIPPVALWPSETPPTYGELTVVARQLGRGGIVERATYGNRGQFVHIVVAVNRHEYCFRKNVLRASDTPYAVSLRCLDPLRFS